MYASKGADTSCCPPSSDGEACVRAELEAGREEGWATGDAPMAACCERELEERQEANRVLGILKKADVSTAHLREKNVAILKQPTARDLPSANGSRETLDNEDDDLKSGSDDDDLDEEFERYRQRRLAEMKKWQSNQFRGRQLLQVGTVSSVDNAGLQKILKQHAQKGPSSRLICQFSVKGDSFSHELDEVMDEIAARHASVNFVRIQKTKGVVINHRDQVNQAALCCFEAGQHKSILFGEEIGAPDEVNESVIMRWLQSCGVMKNKSKSSSSRNQGNGSSEEEEEEEGDECPCLVCGRTYPHEHVKTVWGKRSDSEEESQEDDW